MEENNNQNEKMNNQEEINTQNEEPQEKNEISKNKNLIILVLSLIIVLLVIYIVDLKFIHKEEKPPVDNNQEEIPKEIPEEKPIVKDDKYIKEVTKEITLNGKVVNLVFEYYVDVLSEYANEDEGENEFGLVYDVFVGGKKLVEDSLYSSYLFDGNYSLEEAKTKALNEYADKINSVSDDVFGKIKGDKEYLYFKKVNYSMVYGKYETLIVFGENNNEIFNRAISEGGRGLALDKSCPNYSKFSKEEGVAEVLVYVLEDAIYYLEDNGSCGDSVIPEYKVTLKDNGVLLEKIGDCKVAPEGACQ